MNRLWVRVLRLGFAAFDIVAFAYALHDSKGPASNFFSYFTIESNLLAMLVLLVGALVDPVGRRWAYVRGAATLYMVITGVVYAVLLSHQENGLTAEWINTALHRVTPLVMLLDWIAFSPWIRTTYRAALGWLLVPLAYFAYSLIRGPHAHFYPYPFLNPHKAGGYWGVTGYAVVLAVGMGLLALGLAWIGRRRAGARG